MTGSTKRAIVPEDLYRFTYVSDPQLSPDGRTVAFVRTTVDRANDGYRSQIWLAPADGSGSPRRFTAGPCDSAPRWSPDGTALAFLARRGASAKAQIWLIGAGGGEAWALTDTKEGAADPQWSPDGTQIAFTSQVRAADDRDRPPTAAPFELVPGKPSDVKVIDRLKYKMDGEGYYDDRRRHLFVAALRGQERGEVRQITFGGSNESAPAWSPDGRTLAFVSARHTDRDFDNRSDVWTVATDATADAPAEPRCVTRTTGPCATPVFSPDGYWIAYTGHNNDARYGPSTITGLWLVPADGSAEPRNVAAALDRPIGAGIGTDARYGTPADRPLWTADGTDLLILVSDRGDGPLLRIDPETGEVATMLGGARRITNVTASADGRQLVYAVSDGVMPANLFACNLDAAGEASVERRLTDVNAALFADVALRAPRSTSTAPATAWHSTPG